ncbi:MAG: class I SAM-dependent methyltransferase [Acidimicrobiales bacterium]|nr:class I SAM-dependent methyltransferase [Acidimicrobiales bacterium]
MEGYEPSTYGDRFADIYDDWYPPDETSAQTVDTLAELADPRQPILELGIGTGRLALPLAKRGFDVRGIDASTKMIERLRSKPGGEKIAVTLGDLGSVQVPPRPNTAAEPPPPANTGPGAAPLAPAITEPSSATATERCALVFAAGNTIFGLLSADAQAACFRRVSDVLIPGGRFVVEAFVPPDDGDSGQEDVAIRSMTAQQLVLSAARRNPTQQTISGHYIELRDGSVTLRPFHLRYASVAELDAMADAAGLELEHRWSSWRRDPFTPHSTDHISVWRRPS